MATKEDLAAKLAALDAARAAIEADFEAAKAETAELDALESDRARLIAAHEARRAFCEVELTLPLFERSCKDHSPEPRDDEAIHAELEALEADCSRLVAIHDDAIVICKARIKRAQK